MIILENTSHCTGCSACVQACPKQCITMTADREGFLYPQIDHSRCVECGRCRVVCPITGDTAGEKWVGRKAFASIHTDLGIRKVSSSGGAFTAIAENVISRGGVVFGAAFNDQFEVEHQCTETCDGLAAFRGSKYVQSRIGDAYARAKAFLDCGRLVLFTGTPCQIGGLKSYLTKEYENLICQDIICHGVPSPLAWKKYLKYQNRIHKSEPSAISFRDKSIGWKQFSMCISFHNGKEYCRTARDDGFFKAFLQDYCLRPSCYRCSFKNDARQSDITLADFWGIEHVASEIDDNDGVSLILVHSRKGRELLNAAANMLHMTEVDWTDSTKYNPAMHSSVKMPSDRGTFMLSLHNKRFDRLVKKYCEMSFVLRFKLKVYRILKNRGLI